MTAKRLQWLFAFFTLLAGVVLYAQNPVSIAQLGRSTTVTTTIPVSGTVTVSPPLAVTQSGTWTVQPGNTPNTTPWLMTIAQGGNSATVSAGGALKVDGSASTQPVSGTVAATQSGTWTVQQGTPPWTMTGTGSAGTAATGVVTVQGIASMTPLLVTPGANSAVNVAQFGGTNVVTGTGTGGNGIPRVTISSDSSLAANQSVNVAQMNGVTVTMGAGATGTGVQRVNDVASSATGAAPPASALYVAGIGSGATGGFLVGAPFCDNNIPISITSGTTTLIVTGVSGRHVYICHLDLVTAVANNVAVITGTGATCGTSTAGVFGGSTAANGWNFAANGGIAMGGGIGMIGRTETTGDSICIITSSAGPLAGAISYAIY